MDMPGSSGAFSVWEDWDNCFTAVEGLHVDDHCREQISLLHKDNFHSRLANFRCGPSSMKYTCGSFSSCHFAMALQALTLSMHVYVAALGTVFALGRPLLTLVFSYRGLLGQRGNAAI